MNNSHSFAHLSDIHIGAFRPPFLQGLVVDAFMRALEECIRRNVDFIIISGDLFDSNLPDMRLVDRAVKKMYEVRKNGIGIYVVYGSHDFSPNQSSIVDILASAGLFEKITRENEVRSDNMLLLKFKTHEKTGAKLVGISGYKSSTERQYYEILDRDTLEEEEGFKIFVFHGMISEYKPHHLVAMDSMPISYLPKNFNYYAGGHLHERKAGSIREFDNVVYPGALFGADLRDIENSAKGFQRGFYIVTFSDKVIKTDFVEVSTCDYLLLEYNAMGKSSSTVQKELESLIKESDIKDKLVILKVKGEMVSGKTVDINFLMLEKLLAEMGAVYPMISRSQLSSIEYSSIKVTEYNTFDIEKRIFKESIGSMSKVSASKLRGEEGVKLSISLLKTMKHGRKHNENKNDYEMRIANDSIDVIGLTEELNTE